MSEFDELINNYNAGACNVIDKDKQILEYDETEYGGKYLACLKEFDELVRRFQGLLDNNNFRFDTCDTDRLMTDIKYFGEGWE